MQDHRIAQKCTAISTGNLTEPVCSNSMSPKPCFASGVRVGFHKPGINILLCVEETQEKKRSTGPERDRGCEEEVEGEAYICWSWIRGTDRSL